ncbi:hypothetical protein RvY_02357 [Ramazzottius varieornatus]|uniref:HAT C-terminal dimerisation domain-containing protein n=1 Tax=Ramazzottius varieornatus TaxID=947166 RepID=A0A1D1UN72_RAMVA|nr:hypothetical protein RvY_02357 [Ramazzottius varieornatus]
MAATEIVIDEDDDVEASEASSGDRDRKATEFYSTFFSSLATARESKNSKSYVVHSGTVVCARRKRRLRRRYHPGTAAYVNIKAALVRLLDKADAVAINIDIWSSKRQRGYLGISVHFIDEKFRLRNFLLACPRFKGAHTADAILNLTVEVIADYGLQSKIFYVGTDNGSNIICASKDWFPQFYEFNSPADSSDDDSLQQESHQEDIQELEEAAADNEEFDPVDPEELDVDNNLANEVRCVAHSLQLVVKKPVKKCAVVNKAVEALASVVSSIRHSVSMTEAVKKEFEGALKARCATRWNSNFIMAEHALQMDWDKVGLEKKYRLSPDYEIIFKQFVTITAPFQTAFLKLQRDSIPAICQVLLILYGLRVHLHSLVAAGEYPLLEAFTLELLGLLEERFDKLEEDDLGSKRAVETEKRTREIILRMMREVKLAGPCDTTPLASSSRSASKKAEGASELFSFMEDEVPLTKTKQSPAITVEAEYELYLNNDWSGENPLNFYRMKGTQDIFKRMCVIAKQILCAPATTAGIERIFSISGRILNEIRLRTNDLNFERLLFCNVNQDLLDLIANSKPAAKCFQ